MANSNFVIAVPSATVVEFKALVIKAAKDNDIVLLDRANLGNGQCWSLKGLDRPSPSVIGYDSGQVVWQNLNPQRLGIECKFIKKWANTQSK